MPFTAFPPLFFMRFSFLLLILVSLFKTYSQSSIDTVINGIVENNELQGQYLGIVGTSSYQYKRYERIKNELKYDQLVQLSNHTNAVVRCYAFWALADRREADLFKILIDHINDTTLVYKQFADVVDYTTVSDFFIDLLTQEYIFTADYFRENNSQITNEEKGILDSIVLYSSAKIKYLDRILSSYEPDPKFYSRVKELAKRSNLNAFPALAKHQKSEDVDLILSLNQLKKESKKYPQALEKLFQSIEEFPDEKFFDYLKEFGVEISNQRGWSRAWIYFYRAVAKYKNENALAILERPFHLEQPISNYHLRFINNSLGMFPDPVYEGLIIEMWRDYKYISEGSFNYLKQRNDSLTFSLLENYLEDFEEVYSGANEQKMLPIILPFSIIYNKERTVNLIAGNLRTNTITPFKEFYPFVIELQSLEFIEPLFDRIDKEWNGHVFYLAVEMIVSFGNEQLNEQIISRSKRNRKIVNKYTESPI